MTDLEQTFLRVLDRHRGLAHALSVPDMAEALGLGRDKPGQRLAQRVKASVVEAGHLVGSSCRSGASGWYLPETAEEIDATVAQYRHRITALARLLRQTEGAAQCQAFLGQLALEFEEEVRA